MRRWLFWICLLLFVTGLVAVPGGDRANVRVADGFDHPVGNRTPKAIIWLGVFFRIILGKTGME